MNKKFMGKKLGLLMVDFTLTSSCRGVIKAILAAPIAWQSPAELIRALGIDAEEETIDTLAVLDAGGWLEVWERDDEIVVTLSVAAASKLDVRLVEVGPKEVPRWANRGEPEPKAPRAVGVFRQERASTLELVVDTTASPESQLEAAEEQKAEASKTIKGRSLVPWENFPKPTLFLGSGLSPWPGPGVGRKASCPSCLSRRLSPTAYCLVCDRWGLDHLLLDLPSTRRPVVVDEQEEERLAASQRMARKEKRKRRRVVRAIAVAKSHPLRRNRLGPKPA